MKTIKNIMVVAIMSLVLTGVLCAECATGGSNKDLVKREMVYDLEGNLLQDISYEYDYKGRYSVIHEKTTDDRGQVEDCYELKYSYGSYYYDVERTHCKQDNLKTVTRYDYHDNELSAQFVDKSGQVQTYEYNYAYITDSNLELRYTCFAGDDKKTAEYTKTYNEKGDQIGLKVVGFDKREAYFTTIFTYDARGKKIRAEYYDVEEPTPGKDYPQSVTVFCYDQQERLLEEDTLFYAFYDHDRIERRKISKKEYDDEGRLSCNETRNIVYDNGKRTEKMTGNRITYEYF